MEEKYRKAIIAGLTCGIILGILTLFSTVGVRLAFGNELQSWVQQYSSPGNIPSGTVPEVPAGIMASGVISLLLLVLGILTFFGAGALAVKMAAPYMKTRNDVMAAGAIAGAVAELVHRPIAMVLSMVMDIVRPISVNNAASGTLADAISTAISQLVCCFPVVLVSGIILAVVGALLYGMLKLKI